MKTSDFTFLNVYVRKCFAEFFSFMLCVNSSMWMSEVVKQSNSSMHGSEIGNTFLTDDVAYFELEFNYIHPDKRTHSKESYL